MRPGLPCENLPYFPKRKDTAKTVSSLVYEGIFFKSKVISLKINGCNGFSGLPIYGQLLSDTVRSDVHFLS